MERERKQSEGKFMPNSANLFGRGSDNLDFCPFLYGVIMMFWCDLCQHDPTVFGAAKFTLSRDAFRKILQFLLGNSNSGFKIKVTLF